MRLFFQVDESVEEFTTEKTNNNKGKRIHCSSPSGSVEVIFLLYYDSLVLTNLNVLSGQYTVETFCHIKGKISTRGRWRYSYRHGCLVLTNRPWRNIILYIIILYLG